MIEFSETVYQLQTSDQLWQRAGGDRQLFQRYIFLFAEAARFAIDPSPGNFAILQDAHEAVRNYGYELLLAAEQPEQAQAA